MIKIITEFNISEEFLFDDNLMDRIYLSPLFDRKYLCKVL